MPFHFKLNLISLFESKKITHYKTAIDICGISLSKSFNFFLLDSYKEFKRRQDTKQNNYNGIAVLMSVIYAECRKLALYAECHYAGCRGAIQEEAFCG